MNLFELKISDTALLEMIDSILSSSVRPRRMRFTFIEQKDKSLVENISEKFQCAGISTFSLYSRHLFDTFNNINWLVEYGWIHVHFDRVA
uniref:FTH domain-containing protein n=1 Tax=Panagrellus redivivus TaxID=6233 RepID=A0A7E4VJU4_PANRE